MAVDLNDFKRFETTCKGRKVFNKKYMGYCIQCNGQRGYIFKAEDGKLCKKCIQPQLTATLVANKDKGIQASADLRRGKPSANKGKKTGKPAWNNKNISPIHKNLRERVSRRLRHSLSTRGLSKNKTSVFQILGYNVETLMKHLESKFEPGMSWENRGEWEIDHVIPDSWFNYSSMEDQLFKDCWALSNLQPMWKLENISKGARYAGTFQSEEK